jgi:hypothetical protein
MEGFAMAYGFFSLFYLAGYRLTRKKLGSSPIEQV